MSDAGTQFQTGDVVSGLEPTELVEITKLAPFAGKTLVEGIGVESRRVIRRPLASEDFRGQARAPYAAVALGAAG